MSQKDIFRLDDIEDLENYIPKRYKKKRDQLYKIAEESYERIVKYIEDNIKENDKDELVELLEEYYFKCDKLYIYNEKCHFVAGKVDGIKFMAAVYNVDTSDE